MSDPIKHECGIAFLRLRKPLQYYIDKYGSPLYAINKLYILMEKQHNRGHDGAGLASIKLDMPPGKRYISLERSNSASPIKSIFRKIHGEFGGFRAANPESVNDSSGLKDNVRFMGELLLGHLRYGTYGDNGIESCHPFLRENNWMTRTLLLAGNFNLTNVGELFTRLVAIGQHPKDKSDTVTILEKIGHFLDEENERLFRVFRDRGKSKREISSLIGRDMNIQHILKDACKKWDGGFVAAGMLGHGDAFIVRDPAGIRPAFYYADDEIVVAASERPAIQIAFDLKTDDLKEIPPGRALIVKRDGSVSERQIIRPRKPRQCSFERIYFSRGNDADIYSERKKLGRLITPRVLESIDHDVENTVFSFIPNTAEVCFYGMMEAVNKYCDGIKTRRLTALMARGGATPEEIGGIIDPRPRFEKIAVKDAKMRTFITNDDQRDELVAHVYDITYGVLKAGADNLVMVDDSIVRGTTLRESILRILDRLGPRRIVFVSSAPQIRYPDCYGIDMAKLGDFIAFQAAVELLRETGQASLLDEIHRACLAEMEKHPRDCVNQVKRIYQPFSQRQISVKISELLRPPGLKSEVMIIYQNIENLHLACPNHLGDWYFTGDYPTPGGVMMVNRSFINFMEGRNTRAY